MGKDKHLKKQWNHEDTKGTKNGEKIELISAMALNHFSFVFLRALRVFVVQMVFIFSMKKVFL